MAYAALFDMHVIADVTIMLHRIRGVGNNNWDSRLVFVLLVLYGHEYSFDNEGH